MASGNRTKVRWAITTAVVKESPEGEGIEIMPFNKFVDYETLTKERIDALSKSVRSIRIKELKKLGEELFPCAGDVWRDAFFNFIAENKNATYATGLRRPASIFPTAFARIRASGDGETGRGPSFERTPL
jgi:hypothetical protein